jgi:hypothetical protein
MLMTSERHWRTASYSNDNGTCVQVANSLDAVRDSKNPAGPVLAWAPETLGAFLLKVKGGRFDG